jgi:hypothetical protein
MITSHLCKNVRYYLRDIGFANVRIYVYFNVMPANCPLQLEHVAGFGTYKTCLYNCDAFCVLRCVWC